MECNLVLLFGRQNNTVQSELFIMARFAFATVVNNLKDCKEIYSLSLCPPCPPAFKFRIIE